MKKPKLGQRRLKVGSSDLVLRDCCEVWPRFVALGVFSWMKLDDGTKVMPYIYDTKSDFLLRINKCPSCGADVRNVQSPPNVEAIHGEKGATK